MANLNAALTPNPQVTCFTRGGQVASAYTGDVTVSLISNPTGATLGGTTTVSASAGVATFTNLTLNRSGKDFRIRAIASGLRASTSDPFSIPTECVFTTLPSTVEPDETFTVAVTVRDGAAATDTNYNGVVTLSIYTKTANGVLSGTRVRPAINGVATFTGLSIDEDGDYTFIASASTVATAYPPAAKVSSTVSVSDGYVLTAVDLGSDTYGKDTVSGSISPAAYLGSIRVLTCQFIDPDYRLTFSMSGAYSQNAFTSITVNGITYNTASADSFTSSNTWEWDTAFNSIPAPGNYVVSFV